LRVRAAQTFRYFQIIGGLALGFLVRQPGVKFQDGGAFSAPFHRQKKRPRRTAL